MMKKCICCNEYFSLDPMQCWEQDMCDDCLSIMDGPLFQNNDGDYDITVIPKTEPVLFDESILNISPVEIKAILDENIIGQEEAKKTLSIALYKHTRNIKLDGKLGKSNILLIGPSGSGKTEMIRCLAKKLKLPFTIFDASQITKAGWKGRDAEDCVKDLYLASNKNKELCEKGIILLDEIDKRSNYYSHEANFEGQGVQQALLKVIEDSEVTICVDDETVTINTEKILFVFAGAFTDIDKFIRKRIEGSQRSKPRTKTISLNKTSPNVECKPVPLTYDEVMAQISPEDLVAYGLVNEFVGRISLISVLQKLTDKQLIQILTTPKNSVIRRYETLFASENCSLNFTPGALKTIASYAQGLGTGARALQSCVDKVLLDVIFNLKPNKQVIINTNMVKKALNIKSNNQDGTC